MGSCSSIEPEEVDFVEEDEEEVRGRVVVVEVEDVSEGWVSRGADSGMV